MKTVPPEGGEEPVTEGLLLTVIVVAGLVLYRIVWSYGRERRRQYPKRVK